VFDVVPELVDGVPAFELVVAAGPVPVEAVAPGVPTEPLGVVPPLDVDIF